MKKKRIKARKVWAINPQSRVKESGKKYSRKRTKNRLKRELRELKREA